MTTNRTDAHRPAAVDFDPESYTWTGDVVDFFSDTETGAIESGWADANSTIEAMTEAGYTWATTHKNNAQCQHCGAHLRYAALLRHDSTAEMLWVGEQCLDNRFSGMTKTQFDHLRKTAQLAREAAEKLAKFNQFLVEHPELAPATYVANLAAGTEGFGNSWAQGVVTDILHKLRQYGSISDKQIAFVVKLVAEIEERITSYVEPVPAGPAPRGRQTVTAEIISIKEAEGYMGGTVLKMTVKFENGSRAYGSVPSSLPYEIERGMQVQFTATFEAPKDGTEDFAFFKRPTKAEIV